MWLDRLVRSAHARVDRGAYDARPASRIQPAGSLRASVERAMPAVVAELKPGRPGEEPRAINAASLAQAYAAGGACGISVLTDPDHFGGSLENLEAARTSGLPLLFKDFVVSERQLEAAAAWGASAVLAIVRLHTEGRTDLPLTALVAAAHRLGLEVLGEAVTPDELDAALEAGVDLVGINSRDLDTLEMDAGRSARLLEGRRLPVPVLHLSGVETPSDVRRAIEAGCQGVLVGSSLMASSDPAGAVRALVEVAPA